MLRESRILTPLLAVAMGLAQLDCSAAGGRFAPATLQSMAARPSGPKLAALWPHFERQKTPTSCSVASVITVLNTWLAAQRKPTISQQALLATQSSGAWARLTADDRAPGVTLDQLALYTLQAFYAHGLTRIAADVVHLQTVDENSRQALQSVLERNNIGDAGYFVLANFLQSEYTRAGERVGHMSVVGQFDPAGRRVLVLDVDPSIPDPYWVPFDTFVEGMATADDETGEPRGYMIIREP